ncbi:MAG TPA: hypothetical protein VFD00_06005 [Thermoclostridium sp.]|nr:hypothetical protein [Thermoclostridium sp.]
MSMKTYGVSDYGLYVTNEDLKNHADNNEADEYEVAENAGMFYYSNADGTAYSLFTNNEFDVGEYFYIAPVKRYPSFFAKGYENKEELLCELKEQYGKYLPEDFDYENKCVHYAGTVFE